VIRHLWTAACAFAIVLATVGPALAQEKSGAGQEKSLEPAARVPTIPLRIQVVISRYEGEKKLSSMPYMLSVNAGRNASLRMGISVAVPSTSYTPIAAGGAGVNPITSYQYREIGTNIDCATAVLDDGRFRLEMSIEDSSVEDPARSSATDRPSFRSFRSTNSLVLKDGQTAQFTTAVDKVTGYVTKADVTLTVVK